LPLLKRSGKAKILNLTFLEVVNFPELLHFTCNLDNTPAWVENCSIKHCWPAASKNCWYDNDYHWFKMD